MIRYQRHEIDQHLACLEGADKGVVYLFPDITLLCEVRFLSTASDHLRLGHPIEGSGWAPSALWKPEGHEGRDWQLLPKLSTPSASSLNGHHSSQGSDSTYNPGAASSSWKGVKERNVFRNGDEWMVDPLNLILRLGDVKESQLLTSLQKQWAALGKHKATEMLHWNSLGFNPKLTLLWLIPLLSPFHTLKYS